VGFHVFGASLVWVTVLWFHHGLSDHLPELVVEPPSETGPFPERLNERARSEDQTLRTPV
jgi:hypothetical protein